MENNELNEILGRVIASLTEEQKEKAKACETADQLIALLGDLGVELPDELLEDVGGGLNLESAFNRPLKFPDLGSLFIRGTSDTSSGTAAHMDVKGTSGATVVHTDVSAQRTSGKGSTRYV